MTDVASRLVRKLGLKQTPGGDVMKEFAKLVRIVQREGYYTVDQAAISAAKDKFPAEFEPTRYVHHGESIDAILHDIEKL